MARLARSIESGESGEEKRPRRRESVPSASAQTFSCKVDYVFAGDGVVAAGGELATGMESGCPLPSSTWNVGCGFAVMVERCFLPMMPRAFRVALALTLAIALASADAVFLTFGGAIPRLESAACALGPRVSFKKAMTASTKARPLTDAARFATTAARYASRVVAAAT